MRENAELLPPVPASFMMYLCPPFPQHSIEKESRFGPVTKNDEQSENTEGLQQLDPVKQISTASPHIAASWLRDGQNLTLLQRVGHGLISLAYISAGVAVAAAAKLNFQEGSVFMALLFSSIAIFFLFFGAKGLQNICRFKHLRN